MAFNIICKICKESFWIGGRYDPSTNATELDENDSNWEDVCIHLSEGGDYEIVDQECVYDGDECF